MARKSKQKSRSRSTKKKQKKKPTGALVSAARSIGVISTITLTRDMKNAIKAGVNDTSVKLKFSYVGSYKKAKVKKKFDKFNGNVNLIITCGGNKTYNWVASLADSTKFISLVGSTPAPISPYCLGGVTLDSAGGNLSRVQHLVDEDIVTGKKKIALLCNENSSMNADEEADWINPNTIGMPTNKSTIFHAGKDNQADENDSATYQAAFNSMIQANMQAVIVSADPFFQDTMDELVAEANKSGLYVIYPLQDYENAWEAPTSGKATLQGPDLMNSYTSLGSIAASALNTGASQGFVPALSDTNDL